MRAAIDYSGEADPLAAMRQAALERRRALARPAVGSDRAFARDVAALLVEVLATAAAAAPLVEGATAAAIARGIREGLRVDATPLARAASAPSVREIIDAVASAAGLSREALLAGGRSHCLTRPRHVGMWLSLRLTGRSLPQLGRWWGGRDHKTVLHGIRAVEARMRAAGIAPPAPTDLEAFCRFMAARGWR